MKRARVALTIIAAVSGLAASACRTDSESSNASEPPSTEESSTTLPEVSLASPDGELFLDCLDEERIDLADLGLTVDDDTTVTEVTEAMDRTDLNLVELCVSLRQIDDRRAEDDVDSTTVPEIDYGPAAIELGNCLFDAGIVADVDETDFLMASFELELLISRIGLDPLDPEIQLVFETCLEGETDEEG